MPIEYVKKITRADVQANPQKLFVFGDNLARTGMGGQAAEMRGEPNAIGIPTKRSPSMAVSAFFTDADLPQVAHIISNEFVKIKAHLDKGGIVVWPSDGIGTGRAELATRAPTIAKLLEFLLAELAS